MTDTTAKSGAAGASAKPVETEAKAQAKGAGDEAVATGRAAVVGRATVPGESSSGQGDAGSGPKFTRPPGMAPPPDVLVPAQPAVDPTKPGGAAEAAAARTGVLAAATMGLRTSGVGPAVSGGPMATGAARVSDALRGARAAVTAAASRGPRRARLYIKRIDPWSVMKFSFAVSFVLLIVAIVATSVLYLALDAMGVFDSINKALADLVGGIELTLAEKE